MHHEGKKIGYIMRKAHHKPGPHHKHEPIPMEFDEPQAYPLEDAVAMSRDGRHLQEEIAAPMKFVKKGEIPTILSDVETTCSAHTDESSCNADGPCSWCDAAAVRPACHSIENARNLPPAVFSCSKLDQEKIEEPVPEITPVFIEDPFPFKDVETTCFAHTDESSCNADGPCSWCDAAAVRPACHSIENARSLPAAVFACSKLDKATPPPPPPIAIDVMFPIKDVESTCNAHHDESTCNADGPCSWCDAAAVKPACHSIENARNLPAAVFECSKLGEEPNDIGSAFFKMLESLKNRRHHGRHGGHKKHERPPRVESEEDEDDEDEEDDKTEIIAGMPFKKEGYYAKKFRKHLGVDDDEEPHHKRHGGNHGRHHRRHCHGHKICSFIGFFLIGLHFVFIHKLKMAQKQLCIVTGKKIEYPKCKWSKFGKKHTVAEVPVQQHVIVNAPVVQSSSLNDSVAQIHEERDKEMGIVFAPAPTTIAVNQHTMI